MITFFAALALLILGYIFYSKFIEKVFVVDDKTPTPAYAQA
ncbi:MAG: hypothetical protein L0G95_12720, partial [Planococcus sp. (in: firmicutes)]|nr:hypothetical protein [Planococcus sp. (in: firmicutes)]